MSAESYLETLEQRRLIVAVKAGQLHAGPAHFMTPDNRAYLEQHSAKIVLSLGEYEPDRAGVLEAVGEPVLFSQPGVTPERPRRTRPGSQEDQEEDEHGPATAAPQAPAPAPADETRDPLVGYPPRVIHFELPEAVARVIEACKNDTLPKGTVNADGQMIADFPGYVRTYALCLISGDRNDAINRLLIASQVIK